MSILSLIVARKDSKELKDKTIQRINDKYVFQYSIEYSIELPKRINIEILTVVSSDSEIIEKFCLEKHIFFIKRKPELSSDNVRVEDVIYDAYTTVGKEFKYISLLFGNVPTRYPNEFCKAFDFLERNSDYSAVLSMQNVGKYNPAWMFEFNENVLPTRTEEGFRRQDLRQYMIHDGHTILVRSSCFVEAMERGETENTMYRAFGRKIKPMLNDEVIIDIDTGKDLRLAEAILRRANLP